jgi:hypothetical protein
MQPDLQPGAVRPAAARPARLVALAVLPAGFLLGFLDFVWIKYVPSPFGDLGNSSAVWAVAAFAFGYWIRTGRLRAAAAASTMLVIAVPSYYIAAALIQNDDWAVLSQPSSILWMAFGVIAGIVFGIGGTWAHDHDWRRIAGPALPGAVLFAEALLHATRIGDPNYGDTPIADVLINTVLGVLIIALFARQRLLALAAAVPLALAGFAAFLLTGFR